MCHVNKNNIWEQEAVSGILWEVTDPQLVSNEL